jgi:hypothetical protein
MANVLLGRERERRRPDQEEGGKDYLPFVIGHLSFVDCSALTTIPFTPSFLTLRATAMLFK